MYYYYPCIMFDTMCLVATYEVIMYHIFIQYDTIMTLIQINLPCENMDFRKCASNFPFRCTLHYNRIITIKL